ncbi:hypothetical protein NLJ89_g8845 [Agrocybe chaxingu]|uniref:ATP-dependent DNA helicase n=1 Tax=Agrocybe chaxingu TaxID=84603 RepID=A0A9W8MRS8_9AGAR|nr:hypothetical protein NLJ89_g8845 [Agrocybe chaxingu]
MPQPVHDWDAETTNPLVAEQLSYPPQEQHERLDEVLPTLNQEQRAAYDAVLHSMENDIAKLFFLNGPGGTCKTYVYNTICYKLRSEHMIVLVVASSGIAALLIVGGRTAHSTFKIPINLTAESLCNIPKNSQQAELLQRTNLIIWDEARMQHRHAIEALDKTMHDI